METPTQGASGYYVWEAEEKSFEVHVSLDVIDGLSAEVMRGFGAVPKRGAEVGGLLLGSIERDGRTIVRIEDFEPVPCGYTRGPSYLLAAEESETFQQAAGNWQPDAARPVYAVGYYRSHTRDGLALAPEDIELMDHCLSGPSHIALLVKPYATKASTAGFFFREEGTFQQATPLEFPFRRRELTGEEPPERRPLTDRLSRSRSGRAIARPASEDPAAHPAGEVAEPFAQAQLSAPPARARIGGWMWIPLSFIFLLLGVALGYLAALNVGPRGAVGVTGDYSLSLTVLKSEGTLSVRWNGESPAVRRAERGVLEVHDGGYAKTVDLDAAQLRSGKLAFHNVSDMVSFHLTVYLTERLSISEALDWRQ